MKSAESRLEADIEDLLVVYNANVLRHRGLAWLDDYPTHLYNAWGRLVEEEKEAHQGESVDEFELENRILTEDEKKVLHESMILREKERLGAQHFEVGEGSGVDHHEASLEVPASTQPDSSSAVDPQAIPAYNPDQPQKSLAATQVTEAVQPLISQTEEGILNIPHICLKSEPLFELDSNSSLIFLSSDRCCTGHASCYSRIISNAGGYRDRSNHHKCSCPT